MRRSAPLHPFPPIASRPRNLARGLAGRCGRGLAAAAVLAALPVRAPAQAFPPLRPGQPVRAALTAGDPSFVEYGRFKVYRFDATGGETYVLTLRSDAFDAYLSIAWMVGGLTETLASNDDTAEGTDSRLRWKAPATGSYLVVAQSLGSEGMGAFTLAAERAPQPTTAAVRPIRPGESVQGVLAETDAVDEDDDSFYDSYTLQARRGQRLRVEMRSDAFDTFLAFGRAGQSWEATDTDDDGLGEGTNSRLVITIPEDGEYVIRANSVGQAAVGPYTLSVAERRPAAEPVARLAAAGAWISGSLEDGDAETAEGALYDLYSYAGRAGERLVIRMESTRFDTFLALGRQSGGAFQEIAANDDAEGGTDSAVEVTLPAEGVYLVRAQALVPGGYGAYRLRLEPAR